MRKALRSAPAHQARDDDADNHRQHLLQDGGVEAGLGSRLLRNGAAHVLRAEDLAQNGVAPAHVGRLGAEHLVPRDPVAVLLDQVDHFGLELRAGAQQGGIAGRAAEGLKRRLTADLDDRDPDYIRENLPLSWLASTLWYRAEVRNLGAVPEKGPVLLVGNHSGGNLTPDTHVFTLAFSTYFGVERRFHQLAHNLVLSMPGRGRLRKYGTVSATNENAERAQKIRDPSYLEAVVGRVARG